MAGSELAADAFADDLTFELSERQQNVERQTAHAGGVERPRHRHECDSMPIKDPYQLGKVHQRARKPADLVDDDDVDQPRFDILDQRPELRAVERAA